MDFYSHLLHAGHIATPQEHASILAAKLSYVEQRTKLLQDMQDLQARLEDARKQLELLDEQINAHSRLVSPLRRVPPEILRDIFALATPSSALRPVTDRVLHAPWTTMEVCKHWSEVCLMYGSLWSRITITQSTTHLCERPTFAPRGGDDITILPAHPALGLAYGYDISHEKLAANFVARSAELLTTQLQRSKDANLHVTIAVTPTVLQDYGQPYLRILLPHIHRASYLKAPYYILANTPFPRPLDRITEVDVSYHYYQPGDSLQLSSREEQDQVQNTLEPRASVTTFSASIHGFPPRMGIEHLTTQIYRSDTLTRLIINVFGGWTPLRPVIAQLQALTHLQFVDRADSERVNGQTPLEEDLDRIPLPQLLMLSVDGAMSTQPEIFSSIFTPRLTHLSCSFPGPNHLRSVEGFFAASGCKLHMLRVRSTGNTESTLHFLSNHKDAIDTVRVLEIMYKPAVVARYRADPRSDLLPVMEEDDAIRLINLLSQCDDPGPVSPSTSPHSTPMSFFPQLQYLQLQLMKLPAQEFVDMLHSRRRAELRTRLGSCSLADTHSVRQLGSAEELTKKATEQVKRAKQVNYPRDDTSSVWAGWSSPLRSWFPDAPTPRHRNNLPRMPTWAEGLEREPEQKKRLERLVDEGLEIWM